MSTAAADAVVEGPAIIEQMDTTVLIEPGDSAAGLDGDPRAGRAGGQVVEGLQLTLAHGGHVGAQVRGPWRFIVEAEAVSCSGAM